MSVFRERLTSWTWWTHGGSAKEWRLRGRDSGGWGGGEGAYGIEGTSDEENAAGSGGREGGTGAGGGAGLS